MIDYRVSMELTTRVVAAERRYGPLASTHEALGVASEEWDELRDAIRTNDLFAVRREALDLAAALIRLADACGDACDRPDGAEAGAFEKRSVK